MPIERSEILATLARTKPAAVAVRDAAGDERAVALRAGRTKWEHAATVLTGLLSEAGSVAELRDVNGAVLQVLRAEVAPTSALGAGELAPEHRALVAAQDHVLDRFAAFSKPVLAALESALAASVARNAALERRIEQLLALVYRTTIDAAGAVSEASLAVAESQVQAQAQTNPLESLAAEFAQQLGKRTAAKAAANGQDPRS